MSKNTGTVKWYNSQKGYGFILPEAGGKDVFVHVSGLTEGYKPAENQRVEYDLGEDRSGRQVAENVRTV